jgi:hypothetical protein
MGLNGAPDTWSANTHIHTHLHMYYICLYMIRSPSLPTEILRSLGVPTPLYKYWQRKRARGPLLRRLQPDLCRRPLHRFDTDNARELAAEALTVLVRTRIDLERARSLIDVVRRRERAKIEMLREWRQFCFFLFGFFFFH